MIVIKYVFLFILLFLISGCATVFKGYYDKVSLTNPPEDLKIHTSENISMPLSFDRTVISFIGIDNKVERSETRKYYILLRSNQAHTLKLKSAEFEKTVVLYPKMGAGWLILDTVTGIIPIFFDMYTGCFNHFDDINFDSE